MGRYAGMLSLLVLVLAWPSAPGFAQPMTKALVADRIVKVENGVDEFRKYLERRGDNAATAAATAPAAKGKRRGTATESQKATSTMPSGI